MTFSSDDVLRALGDALQRADPSFQQENLARDADLADIGVDSVSVLEALGTLEEHLGIAFCDDDLVGLRTVEQLVGLVAEKVDGAVPDAPKGPVRVSRP